MSGPTGIRAPLPVQFILGAESSEAAAQQAGRARRITAVFWLSQRNSCLGWIGDHHRPAMPTMETARAAWQTARPIVLPGFAASEIPALQHHIAQSAALAEAVLNGGDYEALLLQAPYSARLAPRFVLLGSTYDEGDPQEIVKIEFDAVNRGEIAAEHLWSKLSWLSYEEYDASLRFRFSFGMENYEDVAADPQRQAYASALTEAVFPESAVISANRRLAMFLRKMLQAKDIMYVERIVYFNAPEGGAQFHHDVEGGHLGVVFAQLSGRTAWLALSTEQMLDEIQTFLARPNAGVAIRGVIRHHKTRAKLFTLARDRDVLAAYLNSSDNDPLERLINRCPAFIRGLIEHGHAHILHPGDIILLPQHDAGHCTWHAVYCLDDRPGEALSFAIRHATPLSHRRD
jgi:hypothetical protein